MFVSFNNGPHVLIKKEELAILRAEHFMRWPKGLDYFWEKRRMTPQEILEFEYDLGMSRPRLLANFADNYLDWDEVPKLMKMDHLNNDWYLENYEWFYP